jgi:GNAT superfamily N-acetyltransferase
MAVWKVLEELQRVIVRAPQKGIINKLPHTPVMYTISTDKSRLDTEMIHRFLSKDAYWARNIGRDLVQRSIDNSICFGAYDSGRQVGFARVVTDCATFAYVGDVFVLPSHRGRGVSKQLMQAIREHPDLQQLRRWDLLTRDAHRLYEQFGFRRLSKPERHMEIAVENPYGASDTAGIFHGRER